MNLISVVMSVYNETEQYLKQSIESILSQTYKDFEYIIIIDNPDNSKAISLIKQYGKKDKRIKVLYNERNIGLTSSLNKGLGCASGQFIARMDADDIAEPKRFELQLAYLKKNKLDLIGSQARRISETGQIVNPLTNLSYSYAKIAKLLRYDDCVLHPSWLVKREVYETLNGYREISTCEDYDFLLRALKAGFKIGICDEILMNYRINTKGISRSNGLKQMLSSEYLRKNFSDIDSVTQEQIDLYLADKLSAEKTERYEKA